MTPEDLRALIEAHGDRCDICGSVETWKGQTLGRVNPLSIDHCHETGRVRGLLCAQCNHAIGNMRDDPDLLKRAAEYLERNVDLRSPAARADGEAA